MQRFAVLDVETFCPTDDHLGGLQPWRPGFRLSVLGTQYPGERPRAIPWPTTDDIVLFLHRISRDKVPVVGWNVIFDIASILAVLPKKYHDLVFATEWLDGKDLVQRVDLGRAALARSRNIKWPYGYGLKDTVRRYFPEYAGYEEEAPDFDALVPGVIDENMEAMLKYNTLDVLLTGLVVEKLLSEAMYEDRREWFRQGVVLAHVAASWLEGIRVDTEALRDLEERTAGALGDFLDVLEKWGLPRDALSRPREKARWLYETLGLPVRRRTPGGDPSVDKTALAWAALEDERVRVLLMATRLNTRLSKFVKGLWASVAYNGDGRVHPQPRVGATYTGRFTYESRQSVKVGSRRMRGPVGVALHQMERSKVVRRVIVPPEGYTLVEIDAANQEVRWMAVLSSDETMVQAFERGMDLHALMACRIDPRWDYNELLRAVEAGDPDAKRIRTLGKVANLSLQYRTSAAKLRDVALAQYGVVLSEAEAQRMHAAYRELYQRVPEYWEASIQKALANGYARTLGGRRVALWDWENWQWANESTAINTPIQGTGADQKMVWLEAVCRFLGPSMGDVVKFGWDLHDGLYFYVKTEEVERVVPEMVKLIEGFDYNEIWEYNGVVNVRMPAEVKRGPSWGDLK